MEDYLKRKRDEYVEAGKKALDDAADYLHRNCDDWGDLHEDIYLQYVNTASTCLAKAVAVIDILENA